MRGTGRHEPRLHIYLWPFCFPFAANDLLPISVSLGCRKVWVWLAVFGDAMWWDGEMGGMEVEEYF